MDDVSPELFDFLRGRMTVEHPDYTAFVNLFYKNKMHKLVVEAVAGDITVRYEQDGDLQRLLNYLDKRGSGDSELADKIRHSLKSKQPHPPFLYVGKIEDEPALEVLEYATFGGWLRAQIALLRLKEVNSSHDYNYMVSLERRDDRIRYLTTVEIYEEYVKRNEKRKGKS